MPPGELLLIAQDWQSRVMLLAELQEAGYDVTTLPGAGDALALLAQPHPPVALIVLDGYGDRLATPDTVQALLRLAPGTPLVLIVGAYQASIWEPFRSRVAAVLRRPVSVGEIAALVRQILPPSSAN